MTQYHCPNCAAALEPQMRLIKVMNCDSCDTTLFLDDNGARNIGQSGEMFEAPLLFNIHDRVQLGETSVDVYGHARFSYGRGFWDEFWGVTLRQEKVWISIDEGDVILQRPVQDTKISHKRHHHLGDKIFYRGLDYKVTEIETATCVAVRGSFDEALAVGEVYKFLNAQLGGERLLSGEFWEGGESWFEGQWIDPFQIKVSAQR